MNYRKYFPFNDPGKYKETTKQAASSRLSLRCAVTKCSAVTQCSIIVQCSNAVQ